jgi:hypothetical protein
MITVVIEIVDMSHQPWLKYLKRCTKMRTLHTHRLHPVGEDGVLNPLNAELNPICHLLILLGDLQFMGKCIVSISNKTQHHTVYLYLETAVHVSGGISIHHQERIQLYLQHLVFVTPLLLTAAISWNRFECAVGGVRPPPTAHSNRFQLMAADSSNGVTNTRCCRYSCMRS